MGSFCFEVKDIRAQSNLELLVYCVLRVCFFRRIGYEGFKFTRSDNSHIALMG